MRNPFSPPVAKISRELKLTGIVRYKNRYAGIIDDGKSTQVVFQGKKFKKYFINDIGSNFVIVSRDGVTKKLVIS